ncbi:MAG: hypothetical protein M1834_009395 [Cirrosporium novae-zelandiae]|nr:MAG: hypothetical protein M1834_009395 [Cirrosporium novae-zelandiae]
MLCHCVPRPVPSAKVEISRLLKQEDDVVQSDLSRPNSVPATTITSASTIATPSSTSSSIPPSALPAKRGQPPHSQESPAKKQSKWSPEEDAIIIELRGRGMKWDDISKSLPGRSAISCRLHYQNYLERRSEWDEERKNKLARLYERFKQEMWQKVAEEMSCPWRAAEAMHWQLGEQEMARRAGNFKPFSLTSPSGDASARGRRGSAASSRTNRNSISQGIPPQLPSVAEITAGLPAYAPPYGPPLESPRPPPSSFEDLTRHRK